RFIAPPTPNVVTLYLHDALPIWLDRLDREHDNFRAALDWLVSRNRVEEGLQLASALSEFWYARGYAVEGRERLEHLLGLWGPTRDRKSTRLNCSHVASSYAVCCL